MNLINTKFFGSCEMPAVQYRNRNKFCLFNGMRHVVISLVRLVADLIFITSFSSDSDLSIQTEIVGLKQPSAKYFNI